MVVDIKITFNNETAIFYPGQLIQGNILLEHDVEIIARGLTLTFFGDAEVYWTEAEPRHGTTPSHHVDRNQPTPNRHVHREYRNQETFLCGEIVLFGSGDGDDSSEQIHLAPGSHVYSFTYQLPVYGLLTSFTDSPYGSIRYAVEARLNKPLFRYHSVEKEFFVKGILDLNFIPSVFEPFGVTKRKDFGWICCPDGYISGDLSVPKTGHLPNESIKFTVSSLNVTRNVPIRSMQAAFWQTIDFITFDRKKTLSNELERIHHTPESRTLDEWNGGFLVPSFIPPTTWSGCRIIRINYKIEVHINLSNNSKMTLSAPIIIGTEPCPASPAPPQASITNESYQKREYNPSLNPFLDDNDMNEEVGINEENNNEEFQKD